MSAKKRVSAALAAEVGWLRDLAAVQDAMLGIRNQVLLEHPLTDAQRRSIETADSALEPRPAAVRQ